MFEFEAKIVNVSTKEPFAFRLMAESPDEAESAVLDFISNLRESHFVFARTEQDSDLFDQDPGLYFDALEIGDYELLELKME